MKFEVQNLTELKKVAEEILSVFPSHKLFLLCGEMGAGKTTLTKEFCKILQCEGYVICCSHGIPWCMSKTGDFR